MEDDPAKQATDDKNVNFQLTDMQIAVPSTTDVKEIPNSNPRRRVFRIVLICLGLVDLPAAIAMIALGSIHYHLCSVIAPLFLLLGAGASVLLYPLLVLNFIYQFKEKRIGGHILSLVLLIFKFGSYIAGALIAWLFWDWTTCSHQLFYPAAILAPICVVIGIMQYFIITKL